MRRHVFIELTLTFPVSSQEPSLHPVDSYSFDQKITDPESHSQLSATAALPSDDKDTMGADFWLITSASVKRHRLNTEAKRVPGFKRMLKKCPGEKQ
jgi:hypothetical protein